MITLYSIARIWTVASVAGGLTNGLVEANREYYNEKRESPVDSALYQMVFSTVGGFFRTFLSPVLLPALGPIECKNILVSHWKSPKPPQIPPPNMALSINPINQFPMTHKM